MNNGHFFDSLGWPLYTGLTVLWIENVNQLRRKEFLCIIFRFNCYQENCFKERIPLSMPANPLQIHWSSTWSDLWYFHDRFFDPNQSKHLGSPVLSNWLCAGCCIKRRDFGSKSSQNLVFLQFFLFQSWKNVNKPWKNLK